MARERLDRPPFEAGVPLAIDVLGLGIPGMINRSSKKSFAKQQSRLKDEELAELGGLLSQIAQDPNIGQGKKNQLSMKGILEQAAASRPGRLGAINQAQGILDTARAQQFPDEVKDRRLELLGLQIDEAKAGQRPLTAFESFAQQVPTGFVPVDLGEGDFRARPITGTKIDQDARNALRKDEEARDLLESFIRIGETTGIETFGKNVELLGLLRGRIIAAEADAQELGTVQPGDLPRLEDMLPNLSGLGPRFNPKSLERLLAPYKEALRRQQRKIEGVTSSNGQYWWLTPNPSRNLPPDGFMPGLPGASPSPSAPAPREPENRSRSNRAAVGRN